MKEYNVKTQLSWRLMTFESANRLLPLLSIHSAARREHIAILIETRPPPLSSPATAEVPLKPSAWKHLVVPAEISVDGLPANISHLSRVGVIRKPDQREERTPLAEYLPTSLLLLLLLSACLLSSLEAVFPTVCLRERWREREPSDWLH